MNFTLYRTNRTKAVCNTSYPIRENISSSEDFRRAVQFDHIAGKFTDNIRSTDRFLSSDVVVMDCDNSHSDDPSDWITVEEFQKKFRPFNYVIVYSQHHMEDRGDECSRPRFHVYFPISECRDRDKYLSLKISLQKAHPFFDEHYPDVSRLYFGIEDPQVIWCDEGWNIDEIVLGEDGRKVGRKGKCPAADWRVWRKNKRARTLGSRLENLKETADRAEEIIPFVESGKVEAYPEEMSWRLVGGDAIDTMKLRLRAGLVSITVEAGTNGVDGEYSEVFIGLGNYSGRKTVEMTTRTTSEGEETGICFSGKDSLSLVYAALKSVYLLLKKAEKSSDREDEYDL